MKKITVTIIIILTLFQGCAKKTEPISTTVQETKEVGTFIKSTTVSTSYNEPIKSDIETTEGSFAVLGHISAMKGSKVIIKKIGNRWYLQIGENKTDYRVLGI